MTAVIIGLFYGLKNISAQVFFWRLFYLNFSSSEISFGIILGAWFFTNLSGLLIGQKFTRGKFSQKLLPLTFLLELAGFYSGVYILANGRSLFSLLPGQIFDLPEMTLLTIITLLSLQFFSGMEFIFLALSPTKSKNIYRGELLGFILGGIASTYFLFPLAQRYFLYLLYLFSLSILIFLSAHKKWKLLSVGVLFSLLFSPVQIYQKIESKNIPGISRQLDTPYQNIKVTSRNSQIVIYQNNQPALTLPATITVNNELAVILAKLFQPPSNNWLVLGNYPELSPVSNKVPGLKIVWWEKDKNLARLVRQYLDVTKFQFISEPPDNYFLSGQKFPVILIYGLVPRTFAQNYYFQKKFFLLLKKALLPDGILLIDIPGSETYLSPELRQFNSCIFQTLKSVFPNVTIIPGETNFLIATNKPIPIRKNLINYPANFATKIITKNYLNYLFSEERLKKIESEVKKTNAFLNTELKPAGVFYYLSYLRSYSKGKIYFRIILISGLLILGILVFWYLRRQPGRNVLLAMGTSSFTIFIFYWLILALFQMKNGYLYQWLGLFSATFMLGNFLGTHLKFLTGKSFSGDIAPTIFLLGGTTILRFFGDNNYILLVLTLGSGLIIGWQFLWASKQLSADQQAVNVIYTTDIFGSSLAGSFTGFLFFFPGHLGIIFIFLILIKLLNNFILLSRKN